MYSKPFLKPLSKEDIRNLLISLSFMLCFTDIIQFKRYYGNVENFINSFKIISYYKDHDNLTDEEIEDILKDINSDIKEITTDEKFNIDKVDTEEEKEIYFSFLDFYNDNPYLNKKGLYEKLHFAVVDGMAEIITSEYLDGEGNFNCSRNTTLIKALIEIVGKDLILKTISYDDITYLMT